MFDVESYCSCFGKLPCNYMHAHSIVLLSALVRESSFLVISDCRELQPINVLRINKRINDC